MKYPKETKDQKEIIEYFGEQEDVELVRLHLPYPMVLSWPLHQTIKSFYCHVKVRDSLFKIFDATLAYYGLDEIKRLGLNKYGGCYNQRPMRGSKSTPSLHSYGIAVDLDPNNNRLKWGADKAHFARPEYDMFWTFVEENGLTGLGRRSNRDYMHIQAAY